jgi:hypothetical protein
MWASVSASRFAPDRLTFFKSRRALYTRCCTGRKGRGWIKSEWKTASGLVPVAHATTVIPFRSTSLKIPAALLPIAILMPISRFRCATR